MTDNPADHGDEHSDDAVKSADPTQRPRLSRREVLVGGTALGVGGVGVYFLTRKDAGSSARSSTGPVDSSETSDTVAEAVETTTTLPKPPQRWSQTHGATASDVVIDGDMILDVDAVVGSLTITETGRLTMEPAESVTLTSAGNVEVAGLLAMQPLTPDVIHRVHFANVDESKYQGSVMEVASTDIGLWVTKQGVLEANGHPKASWTRASNDLVAGDDRITVDDAAGWLVGDLISITPTLAPPPDDGRFHQSNESSHEYDEATIVAIDGNELTIEPVLVHDHPTISFAQWDGAERTYGAEVLNLTRNVIVSGTESGRAHTIFVHCTKPQNLSNIQFDHLGPRQMIENRDVGVVGRYPVHFHHCGDDSQGSVLKGCLVTRSGNRAFVPHESHGITLDGCVAHDIHGTAYWWDQPGRHNPTGEKPETHDSLWTRCVASKVWASPTSENGYRLAGFNLSGGNHGSNKLIDSVAVGVTRERVTMNNGATSGFHWTEHGQAVWVFENCLAHNIGGDGILSWQNDEEIHPLTDFTAYHCGAHGIEHGAYSNFYSYARLTLVANRVSGIGCHAVTRRTNSVRRNWTDKGDNAPILTFSDIRIDGKGLTMDGVQGLSHKFASEDDAPTIFDSVVITGTTRSGLYETEGNNAPYYVIKNWTVDGVEPVMFANGAPAKTRVDVENLNGDGKTVTITP